MKKKNNCFLFERLFKVKKNGVFLLGIPLFFLEILTFLYYANEESDDVIGGFTKTVQHSIKNKYWSSVQTWHQECTSQKKQNETYYVVAMATLLARVYFHQKTIIVICNLLNGDRGSSSEYT